MTDLLGAQTDYVFFANGLAFVLLAATARALSWRSGGVLPWAWLVAFGLCVGLFEWLEVFVLALGPHPVVPPLRVVSIVVACAALLEFCRRSEGLSRVRPVWLLVPASLAAAAASDGGSRLAEAGFRYLLVFPGAAWAAWVFLRRSRSGPADRRRLDLAGVGFALVAVTSGLVVPAAGFVPASAVNAETFRALTGVPVQYARCLAAMLLAVGLWTYYCSLPRQDERATPAKGWSRYEQAMGAVIVLVVLGGWVFTEVTSASERAKSHDSLRARAATVAAMLPSTVLERLTETSSGPGAEDYAQIRSLLQSVCAASPDVMSAAIVVRQGGAFFYLAEAIADVRLKAGERSAGPGDRYRGPDDAVASLLLATGPSGGRHDLHEDHASLSNLVPVRGAGGEVVGVLDLRVDPAERRRIVARARLAPILLTLLTSLVVMAFFVSERKMAESTARVAASEQRYRGLVEGSPNGIMLLDREGRCLTISHNGLRAFSAREADVVGHRLAELWPPEERPSVAALTERVSKGERATLDTRYTEPDGGVVNLELVLNPVTDDAGRVTHQVGIVSDVTERQRAQAALERSHRFTQVILAISARFLGLGAERVDGATREALHEIGSFLCVDRAQLFHLSPDRLSFSLTHEWCRPGIPSRMPALQSVPVEEYPWSWSLLERVGHVLVPEVDGMPPEGTVERVRLREQGVGAFLCVPVHRRGAVTGFLALDVFGRRREWPADEVAQLRIVADVLSNGLARKLADEALRESEQRFQRAFRNNPAAMAIMWTENQRIVEVNEAFLALVDRQREDVVGRTVEEIRLIEADDDRGSFSQALAAGEPLRHRELQIKTGKDERRHVSLSMDAFELAGQRFMLAVALDLSARVEAEEALREREEVFRSISAAAQDGIIMIDANARVTVWNDAAERMFGYTQEEAEGQPLYSLILPEDYAPGFMEGFGQFRMSGGGPFIGTAQQVLAQRKDGTQIPVELLASAVNVRGRWHAVGILRDITERLKVEEELWKAKEETEGANAELQRSVERANRLADEAALANAYKSEFLANMSHEIRTPMNGIIGMTGLLLDTTLAGEQREYAETVRSCADSLLTIINDILDFSKIEAGKLDLETLDFDLAGALEDTLELLAVRARQKGLAVACLIDPSVPTLLRGDPGRLRQVITNLFGNAIKFTEHGEVGVEVGLEASEDDHVLLRFVVRDTGIGIPPGKVSQLFQPFTQVDASTTRRFGGTGLGLSISRRLAEMMGGTIGVESDVGVGSRFWFTARFERQAEAQPVLGAAGDLEGIRVLGQDDNPTNRLALAGMLESWGCRHTEVGSGEDVLAALRDAVSAGDPYRVAILDVKTPDDQGDELGRRISADPDLARTALVVTTSVGLRGDATRYQEAGFAGYLTKPVKASQLRTLLATLTARAPGAASGAAILTRHSLADAQRRKTRLLLAEDNITNQKVAIKVLEKMGHRVDAVANGVEAIKALRTMPYDLVFMDVQMPEMDGLEATRRIRDPETGVRNPRIPIVAMTAHAMKGDRERCLAAGMDDYVSKPISPRDVADAIARRLPAESQARPNSAPAVQHDGAAAVPAPSAGAAAQPGGNGSGPGASGLPERAALLNRLGGDEEVFVEVIKIYLEDVPRLLAGMDTALEAGDAKTLRRLAHTLKGSSGTAGAEALQEASFRLEQAAAAGDLAAAAPLVPPVKQLFTQVLETMGRWVSGTAAS